MKKFRLMLAGLYVAGMLVVPTGVVFAQAAPTEKAAITDLVKIDTKVGQGKEAISGSVVHVNYTGWLYDASAPEKKGAKFDSSIGRAPFGFSLGAQRVIKGWDQGVVGMKVGGQRTLIIPPELGYGARGAGGLIPPNATLIFDVELLTVD